MTSAQFWISADRHVPELASRSREVSICLWDNSIDSFIGIGELNLPDQNRIYRGSVRKNLITSFQLIYNLFLKIKVTKATGHNNWNYSGAFRTGARWLHDQCARLRPERTVRGALGGGGGIVLCSWADTLLSRCLSPPSCINGYRRIKC